MRSDIDEEVRRAGWIRDSAIHEAACLTFVRDLGIARVAEGFGAVTEHGRTMDFPELCEEAFACHGRYPMIGLRRCGDWTLVVEDDWSEGARSEVLNRVSRGTEAVSVFWNDEMLTRFSYAADGELRTAFEALVPDFRSGTRPDELERLRAGLPWPTSEHGEPRADPVGLMLALSARVTGVRLTPESFAGEFATYPVAPWPDGLPTSVEGQLEPVAAAHPEELVTALLVAGPELRRRVAATVSRFVLERTGGLDEDVVGEAVSAMMAGRGFEAAAVGEVVRMATWKLRRELATSKERSRVRAVEVLRQATNPDPLVAVFATLSAAGEVSGVRSEEITGLVRAVLADR